MSADLSQRSVSILKKLQQSNKDPNSPERLVREKRAKANPPSSNLYRLTSGKRNEKPTLAAVLDSDLEELSAQRLIVLDGRFVYLSQSGVGYQAGILDRLSKSARLMFILAVGGMAIGAASLAVGIAASNSDDEAQISNSTEVDLDETESSDTTPESDEEPLGPSNKPVEQEPPEESQADVTESADGTDPIPGVDDLDPPRSTIDDPADEPVAGSITFAGTAVYRRGIHHVEAVLVETERAIYWNPTENRWQQRFEIFTLDVEEPSSPETAWTLETTLGPGTYRLRTWARGMDGSGEDAETKIEFSVPAPNEVTDDVQAQIEAMSDPSPQAEELGDGSRVRLRTPQNGSFVGQSVTLRAGAEGDIVEVQLVLQDETGRYWNFDAERWQTEEVVAGGDGSDLVREVRVPPGSYSATVTGSTSKGETATRTNSFSVFESEGS